MKGLLLFFSFFIPFKSFSQDTTGNHAHTFSSISFFYNEGETTYSNHPSFQDFLRISSVSIFPSSPDSFFQPHSLAPLSFTGFYCSMGFGTKKMKIWSKARSEWQMGISYSQTEGSTSLFDLGHTISIPGDTSQLGNLTLTSDTSLSDYYSYSFAMDGIALDAARIFLVDLSNRLMLSGGIGMQTGVTINSIVKAVHDTVTRVDYYINGDFDSLYAFTTLPAENEQKHLKSNIYLRSYLPFVASFRLAKKDWWLHSFSIALRGTVGVECIFMNHAGYFNSYWTAGVGINYSL